jgi:hypothetical protein
MIRQAIAAIAAALLVWGGAAHASGGTGSAVTATTLGTSSAQALAANTITGYRLIIIDNESATASIACTLNGTAALNTAGSITLAPQTRVVIGGVPNVSIREPLNCIASAASTPLTIWAW